MKDIIDYLHLYVGYEESQGARVKINGKSWTGKIIGIQFGEHNGDEDNCLIAFPFNLTPDEDWAEYRRAYKFDEFKLLLRPLSDMTEEDFKEFAKPESFAAHDGYWYACNRAIDPDFEGTVIEHINDACDDDPENVLMLHIATKHLSCGWIQYEEMYHSLGVKGEAAWFRFLLSKGFDLFDLIPAGLAIDKTKRTVPS